MAGLKLCAAKVVSRVGKPPSRAVDKTNPVDKSLILIHTGARGAELYPSPVDTDFCLLEAADLKALFKGISTESAEH